MQVFSLVLLGVLFVLLLCYDLIMVLWFGWNYTLSQVLSKAIKTAPILAFLMGLIVGHLVWPITNPENNQTNSMFCGCSCNCCKNNQINKCELEKPQNIK